MIKQRDIILICSIFLLSCVAHVKPLGTTTTVKNPYSCVYDTRKSIVEWLNMNPHCRVYEA